MKKALKITCIVVAILFALIVLVAGIAFFWLDNALSRMNYVTDETTIDQSQATVIDQLDGIQIVTDPETGEEIQMATDPDTGEWVPVESMPSGPIIDAGDIIFPDGWELPDMEIQGKEIVNIMLVGQDARPGESEQRSDAMILMTFNKKTGEVFLTSFLRDQYVQIPGFGNTKLCHAYSYGGMTLMNQTIQNHYGIEVDGNVTFNFEGFEQIIDMLGGVEIELTAKEAKALNELVAGKWSLKEGKQVLTGKQALRYSRLRHIDSDFQRAARQRKVIMSIIEAYKNRPLSEMMEFVESVMPLITTNIPKSDIYGYAFNLFPMLSGAQMKTQQIPAAGTFQSGLVNVSEGYMASCQYNIDFAANREILNKIFDDKS